MTGIGHKAKGGKVKGWNRKGKGGVKDARLKGHGSIYRNAHGK